jgi:IclR family acetate operon transcriptional repressor
MPEKIQRPQDVKPLKRAAAAYPIESVEKACRVLLMLRDQRELRVTSVASTLGVARSTAHRILTTIEAEGFLSKNAASRYEPGPLLLELGMSLIGVTDLSSQARPVLEHLNETTSETIHLVLLDGADIVFVDGVEGTRPLRVGLRIGERSPAFISAAGKALLAELDDEAIRALHKGNAFKAGTDKSVTSLDGLMREVGQVRQHGYATNFSESEEDLTAISVAVPAKDRPSTVAISLSAPSSRLGPKEVPGMVHAVADAAYEIGQRISHFGR